MITSFELFAANAPIEVPGWFRPTMGEKPIHPFSDSNLMKDLSKEQEKTIRAWIRGDYDDLPEDLAWFKKHWTNYHDQLEEWNINHQKERLFQWRIYYAIEMGKRCIESRFAEEFKGDAGY